MPGAGPAGQGWLLTRPAGRRETATCRGVVGVKSVLSRVSVGSIESLDLPGKQGESYDSRPTHGGRHIRA
jgi:hypothetical protein